MDNLSICQECHENPAVYGDGLTWSRCPQCQLKKMQSGEIVEKESPESVESDQSFPHEIVKELTSIIIPVYMNNYTLFHYTGNCIGSVREHTPRSQYELVVIDNGSPVKPPSPKSFYADKVIQNEENLGVTKAWNQGIRMSVGEYIVLLNNDVQVFTGWFEELKRELLNGHDLVMAHPMYSLTEPFARGKESSEVLCGDKKLDPLERDFSCVMFRRSLIEEIGQFDEQFFNYCSDSDFFRRMEGAGKKWKMVDTAATSHISDATGFSIPETAEIMNKDRETFDKKWKNKEVVEVFDQVKEKERSLPEGAGFFRTPDTGDSVFFLKDGAYHHIADPETYRALGGEFGVEKTVSMSELSKMGKYGEIITLDTVKKYA